MKSKGNQPISIQPFPVGQATRLPDATEAHICSLKLVSEQGKVVGFDAVLFLVVNTGAEVLIANNLLDFLGILKYHPPVGYEDLLRSYTTTSPTPISIEQIFSPKTIDYMIRTGQCLVTEQRELNDPQHSIPSEVALPLNSPDTKHAASALWTHGDVFASKQKELGIEEIYEETNDTQSTRMSKEERAKRIDQAAKLKCGQEPPTKDEVTTALDLLKKLAENPSEQNYSCSELEAVKQELSKGRPEWSNCLTSAHTRSISEDAAEAKAQIEEMMDFRFAKTVFAKTLSEPCSFSPFEIKTRKDSLPERSIQPRRFKDPKIRQLIKDWTDSLLKDGMITKSSTPVAAPVTVVVKKGREPRVCVDYRERNARTECPIFPMPDVHDFLDDAAGFPFYCSFDCAKMFNQYELVKEHRHLAAFMTEEGTFEPCRILFGLTGGPQHAVRSARPAMREHEYTNGVAFTRWARLQNEQGEDPPYIIDEKTGIVPGSRLDIFIDDCRIPATKPKALVKLCELWFMFCEEHRLILSRKKAKICLPYLPLLGFVISKHGKHLDPNRISCLLDTPVPTSKEGLHALLCSYNFVRMFIPNFSILAAPLYAATKGIIWKGPGSGRSKGTRNFDPQFVWTEELDRCLRQLQTALLSAPILLVPDYLKALFLSVDACLKGEGWVLWQIIMGKDGNLIPVVIHYGSTKYSESESTWEVTRQEAHAIQSALKDCYDYLFYCHFYLLTDHRNLTFLSNSVNRAVIRIRHFMQQFNMTVVHVPGKWNNPADGISRLDPQFPTEPILEFNSATTTEASNGFSSTHRGTDPHQLTDDDLSMQRSADPRRFQPHQPLERIPLFKALCTIGNPTSQCPNEEDCLLCNPGMCREEPEKAQALFTSLQSTLEEYPPTQENENVPDWEIVEEVQKVVSEGRLFLTRESTKRLSQEWNTQVIAYRNPELTIPVVDDLEWENPLASSLKRIDVGNYTQQPDSGPESRIEASSSSRTNKRKVRFQEEVEEISNPEGQALQEKESTSTQTTPQDFRSLKVEMPHFEDFKKIHNNEEGHHGLAHSYRKLMVKCGTLWAEDQATATMIRAELKVFIENCPVCQKVRGLQERIKCKHSFIISRPFLESSYDFIVFETTDRNGNRYIIVVVDNFSKLVELKSVPDRGAEGVARFLMEIKSRYGPIHRLRSDREKAFTSQVITRLNTLAGTEMVQCVVYHPQANSICERQNQIVMIHLRSLCLGAKLGSDSLYAWSDLIPFVFSIVNNTPKLPLAISPLSMIYGIFANYDRPLLDPRPTGESNPVDYVEGLMTWQSRLIDLAEEIQSKYYQKMTVHTTVYRTFQEGDFVLQAKSSTGARGKLVTRWIGPKLVLARRNNDTAHPVLDLFDLVTTRTVEASIEDCRLMKTGWFEEPTMLQDLKKLAALDKEEYEVERVLEHRPPGPIRPAGSKPNDYWFKIKWAGFPDEENSWEPYSELKDLAPLEEYLLQYPNLLL